MKNSTCTEPALHNRMLKYKALANAFSYPESKPRLCAQRRGEYDRLFRHSEIWLYGAEHTAENEFQRSRLLSDIAGFYKAFGLETDKDRPDFLVSELEFMHYLFYKEANAPDEEKASVCRDAARKFFNAHLYPAGEKFAKKIVSHGGNNFYVEAAGELLEFLESEKKVFGK